MKIKKLATLFFLFCCLHAKAHDSVSNILKQDSKKLVAYYLYANDKKLLQYQDSFYRAFPDNFHNFYAIYGSMKSYIDQENAMKHIDFLYWGINSISDTLVYKKIVDISCNGKFDFDATNYFKLQLQKKVRLKPVLTTFLLQKKNKKEQYNFWFFYFDDIYPEKPEKELNKIVLLDKDIYQAMLRANKDVINKRKNEH